MCQKFRFLGVLELSSGFAGFTADQWKNWAVVNSPVVLQGIVPNEHLQYWLLFVSHVFTQ